MPKPYMGKARDTIIIGHLRQIDNKGSTVITNNHILNLVRNLRPNCEITPIRGSKKRLGLKYSCYCTISKGYIMALVRDGRLLPGYEFHGPDEVAKWNVIVNPASSPEEINSALEWFRDRKRLVGFVYYTRWWRVCA